MKQIKMATTVFFGDKMEFPATKENLRKLRAAYEFMRSKPAVKVSQNKGYGIVTEPGDRPGFLKVIMWKSILAHFFTESNAKRNCCWMPVLEVPNYEVEYMECPEVKNAYVTNFIHLRPGSFTMVYFAFDKPENTVKFGKQTYSLERHSIGQDGLIFGTYRVNYAASDAVERFPKLAKFAV